MEPRKPIPIATTLANLNESQKRLLKELRKRLEKELRSDDDDILLLRFLKARDFDVEKAEKMLREHLKFRNLMELEMKDNYEVPEIYQKYCILTTLGRDKDGDPVSYFPVCDLDWRGIAYSIPMMTQIKFCTHILGEHFKICKKKSKHEITGTFIFDLEKMSFSYVASKLVMRQHMDIAHMYEQNYPETLKRCYLINAPSLFQFFFNIYKQFIDPKIINKVLLFGKNGYKESLAEQVDPDVLPMYLGGTRENINANPETPNTMVRGFAKIPTSYYMTSKIIDTSEEGTNDVCIKERVNYDYRVKVDTIHSTLKWYFRTVNYNIRFGIFYVNDAVPQTPKLNRKHAKASHKVLKKIGYEELYPVETVESHIVPERGEHICEQAGTYVFRFDNSFSWLTPKELSYKVEIIAPEKLQKTKNNNEI